MVAIARLLVPVALLACGGDKSVEPSSKTAITILADFHHTAIGRHLLNSETSLAAVSSIDPV